MERLIRPETLPPPGMGLLFTSQVPSLGLQELAEQASDQRVFE